DRERRSRRNGGCTGRTPRLRVVLPRHRRPARRGEVGLIEYAGTRGARPRGGRFELEYVGAFLRRLDWALLLAVAALVGYGVLALAGFLADRGKRIGEWSTTVTAVGVAALPILLVFIQPDVGTALVYTAAFAAVLFVAGTRWSQLAALGAATLVAALAILWLL